MTAVSRPKFTTGIALAGAAAIAMTPVAVKAPDIVERVTAAAPAVQLTAIDNPFPLWEAITQQALGSLQELVNEYIADPVPVLRQIAENQTESLTELAMLATTYVASLGTAVWNTPADVLEILADLQAGNGGAALEKLAATLMTPIDLTAQLGADAFPILVRPIDRLLGLGTAIPAVISPIVDAIMIGASTFIMSVAGTADDVWRAAKVLDVDGAVNALLTGLAVIPATTLGLIAAPFQGWLEASHVIAKVLRDIDPPPGLPTVAATSVPDVDAPSLTLDVVQEDSVLDDASDDEVSVQRVALTTESETVEIEEADEVETDIAVDDEVEADEDRGPKVRTGLAFSPGESTESVTESESDKGSATEDVADEKPADTDGSDA
ncbi:hypothetical protein, partial [Mycolicibacterium phlei]